MTTGKRETIFALVFSSFSKIVTYLLLLVFANLYSQTDYGLGSFALNIRNIVMLFAFIGIPDALVPFIVKKKDISSILKVLVSASLLITILGILFIPSNSWIWPMIITFPLVMFTTLASSFWRAKAKYDAPNRTGLTSIIITLILAYLLKSYGAFGVVASYSAGNMYSFFALVYPIRIEIINSFRGKFNLIKTIPFFKAGLIVTFISGLFSLLIWVNSTLLGVLGSYEDVARFGISSAIAGVILIIPTTLSLFMVTRASQIKDKTKALNVLHRVVRVSFFSSLMSSILLVTLLPWIIKIFFGKYQGIELPTSILIIGTVFFSSYYIIYSYYIGTMNSQRALLPVIAGFAVNIILSLILIPKLSLLGVSLSSSLAHLAILAYIAKNERMKRILVMSLIAILTIYLSSLNYVIGFIVLIVFVPISILLKIITKEDIKVIKEVVLKR